MAAADDSALLRRQLSELLAEPVAAARERARTTFDEILVQTGHRLVLFGSGNIAAGILAALREDGIEPIAFSDNSAAKWGSTLEGLPVLPPEDAVRKHGRDATFLVAIYNHRHAFPETRKQLQSLGAKHITSIVPARWKYHESFLPYYRDDLPHKVLEDAEAVHQAFSLWADDQSRREFVAQVRWRLHGDFDSLAQPSWDDQYFPEELITLTRDEFFVDAGAFDGDTIRAFIARRGSEFRRILALEPDPTNFQRLLDQIASLPLSVREKIDARQVAAGSARTKLRFDNTGSDAAALNQQGELEVDCVPLDELLSGEQPTYIKLDIEGAELEALKGADATLHEARPSVAACVYHRQDHLWQIPLALERAISDCALHLRSHMYECWETVCYAVPRERSSNAK